MNKIKKFESFDFGRFRGHQSDDEQKVELLSELLEYTKPVAKKFMEDRSMDVDFVEVTDPEQFVIEYWPKEYSGRIPKKISYYLDDLAKLFSENIGVEIDWSFSPNGNSQRIEFNLESDIDPKVLSVLRRMKNA